MPRPVLALAALLAAAAAAPAHAEPIAELSPNGQRVTAVTDAAGTLHAVWQVRAPGAGGAEYCRVPAGGTSCTPVELGPPAGTNVRSPRILLRRADGLLVVVLHSLGPRPDTGAQDDLTSVLRSADGGTTWTPPEVVGAGLDALDDAQLTADGTGVETLNVSPDPARFQRVPLGGGFEPRFVDLDADGVETTNAYEARLTRLPDGRTAVVGSTPSDDLRLRALGAGADPHAQASWTPWAASRSLDAEVTAAGAGPTGSWALVRDERDLRIVRWTGDRFARPSRLGALGRPLRSNRVGGSLGPITLAPPPDLQVDPAGRLHMAWVKDAGAAFCGPQPCLQYRRSLPQGLSETFEYPLARPAGEDVSAIYPLKLDVAANEGGSGWLVWNDRRSSFGGRVRAVPLVTPPAGARTGSLRLGGRTRVTIADRAGCLPAGSRFVHRVSVTGRRSGVRIASVRLTIDDGALARTVRRAPYRAAFTLAFPPGTRHVAGAEVRYRVSGGRLRTARIGRTFTVCA